MVFLQLDESDSGVYTFMVILPRLCNLTTHLAHGIPSQNGRVFLYVGVIVVFPIRQPRPRYQVIFPSRLLDVVVLQI